METIGEEVLSALPPPHTPLAAIPSREDVIENKGKKGKKASKKKTAEGDEEAKEENEALKVNLPTFGWVKITVSFITI